MFRHIVTIGCLSVATLVLLADLALAVPSREFVGVGSWYGGRHEEGRRMAGGCVFHAADLVAASRSLAIGTWVRVTNTRNNRAVIVRVLDRGPYIAGRVVDVSRGAAERLGMLEAGLAPVHVEVLKLPLDRSCPHLIRR